MSETYATKEAYENYVKYLALKKHFSSEKYDYHTYNGKVKASFDTFKTRNDVFFFYKISKLSYSTNLILSNIIIDPKCWIRDLLEEQAQNRYIEWKGRIDSLTETFKSDLNELNLDYKSNFLVSGGNQHPPLLTFFLQNKITLETFSILMAISNVEPYWKTAITDKIIARDKILLAKKYYPFLSVDKKKFSNIVRNSLETHK